ncbi:HAD-IA family hydrolase [Sphingomonas sp.]|uniref:HAD-IA family hydrolase n=1 Tax=Sphingomonas sp. TaxID=28214 RepID=UPI003D6CCC2C
MSCARVPPAWVEGLPGGMSHAWYRPMTIRAIMVDVDGVIIVHPDARGWSAHLERDVGVPASALQTRFFEPHWDDVIHGRASLRERLAPVLNEISPHVTCDALVDYWFGNDAHMNHALLAELASIRAAGTAVHLATVQDHERAHYLWHDLDLRSRFDGLHYAAELGCAKPAPGFFRSIEARTGFRPQDLFLIDDSIANVEGATACGWAAALWTGTETVRSLVHNRLRHDGTE